MSLIVVIVAVTSFCHAATKPPVCHIPLAQSPVTLDGQMTSGEWDEAAVITNFQTKRRDGFDQPTTAYMKYDEKNIYIAVVCQEPDGNFPEAYKRQWDDLLFDNDDSVMFVLGMRDPLVAVQEKIDVGGYDGAMGGSKAKADWYYTYTVNAVGSKQRTFNETPVQKALFDAVTSQNKSKQWAVEMCIPLASCGLSQMQGKVAYANVFRFRPPGTTAWFMPGFGGYRAMPLGRLVFLDAEKSKTNQVTREVMRLQAITSTSPAEPSCKVSIQYSPLNGTIVGKADYSGYPKPLTGVLEVTGLPTVRQVLGQAQVLDHDAQKIHSDHQKAFVYSDFEAGSQPARTATFSVIDADGKTVAKTTQQCKAVTAPQWFGTQAGIDYVSKKFPKPWTTPQIQGNDVKLVDKTVRFGKMALPQSISFADGRGELIAGQPELNLSVAGKTQALAATSLATKMDQVCASVKATLNASDAKVDFHTRMEPDGFMEVKFRLRDVDVAQVDRLQLKIPLTRGQATFIKHGPLVQRIGQLHGTGYRNQGKGIWVGTYDKGLAFNSDMPVFFSRNVRHQIEVLEEADNNYLVLNFVDGPKQIKAGTIFRFFLQPTPTKPMPQRRTRTWVKWKWERWAQWHGYPDVEQIPEIKKWTSELKAENKIGLLYTCQGLREDAPYFKEFRSDLELQPRWRYYNDRRVNCYATNKRGPEGDLQLWGWQKLINEAGVRGFVSDGLMPAWGDSNPALRYGGGRDLAINWEQSTPSRIVAQRNFIKRLCGMLTDTGEPYSVVAHTGGGIDINILSFTDGYMEGEQLQRYNRGFYPTLPMYAIGYTGEAWGWRSYFWPKRWRNYQSLETIAAYGLLFNTEMAGHNNAEGSSFPLDFFYGDFPATDTKFIPFYKTNSLVSCQAKYALSSTHLRDDKAMVVVSNLREIDDTYTLDLTELFSGKNIIARELLSNRIAENPRSIQGKVGAHGCDVWRVEVVDQPVDTAAKPAQKNVTQTMDAKQWKVPSSRLNGVTVQCPVSEQGVDGWMKIKATPSKSRAIATFQPWDIKDNATLIFDLIPQRRFSIYIGDVILRHDHGWFLHIGEQRITNLPKRFMDIGLDQIHQVALTVNNGLLSVQYDDTALIVNQPVTLSGKGNAIKLDTWHDNALFFKPKYMSNRYDVMDMPAVSKFHVDQYVPEQWKVNTKTKGVSQEVNTDIAPGRKGIAFYSEPHKQPANVTFSQTFGDDLYVDLDIKISQRFRIQIGPVTVAYGGGWVGYGWYVSGPAQLRGHGWVFRQVPIKPTELANLKISVKDKVLNVVYDGKAVVDHLPMQLPSYGNSFGLETWWDSKIAFTVNEISTDPKTIIRQSKDEHPVLSLPGQ
ncbi:MAG: glycoside hydrolase domain-containing protein [Phycisphaeraceae bacterium JB051]